MVKVKNEHVFPKDGGWMVRHEGIKKTFRFFEKQKNPKNFWVDPKLIKSIYGYKEDAMRYARMMAVNNSSFVVTHKHNGQFKEFKKGNEIYTRSYKNIPITGTIEIIHPIVNNTYPIVETITSI